MRAAVVHPGGEARSGGGGRGGAHCVAPTLGVVGAQCVLLTFGGTTGGGGLADKHQPATTGLIAGGVIDTGEDTLGDCELIHPELGVVLRLILGDRALGGLDVDDHHPTLRIAFQAVDAATHPHSGQPVGRGCHDSVEFDLGADLGEFMAGGHAPRGECHQHRPVAIEFVGGVPR